METGNEYDEESHVYCDTDETYSAYGIGDMPAILNSYESTVDALSTQLAEAVARVKTIQADLIAFKLYEPMSQDKMMRVTSLIESNRAFLATVDGAKCARCGQVGVGPCGCGFQGETDGKAGAR
jgi:hypothetical protein